MIYEIKEFNQEPATDENLYPDTFTDRKFPIFYNVESLNKYLKKNHVYGKVFVYDREEYETFQNASEYDYTIDVPIPIEEWDT